MKEYDLVDELGITMQPRLKMLSIPLFAKALVNKTLDCADFFKKPSD